MNDTDGRQNPRTRQPILLKENCKRLVACTRLRILGAWDQSHNYVVTRPHPRQARHTSPLQTKRQPKMLIVSQQSTPSPLDALLSTLTHLQDSLGRFLRDSSSPALDISPFTTPPPSAARCAASSGGPEAVLSKTPCSP